MGNELSGQPARSKPDNATEPKRPQPSLSVLKQPASCTGRVKMKSPSSTRPNLRDQQRVDALLSVTVQKISGDVIECQTANISRAGMMIACSGDIVNTLAPGKRSPAAGEGIPVTTRFSLPIIAEKPVSVTARCQIVHIRRIARDTFHVGFQFCAFEGSGYQYVDQYVSHQLNPAG